MKKILITGGTGFIGSHLSEYMVRKGYKVIVYDKYNINNSWGWLENSKLKNEIEVLENSQNAIFKNPPWNSSTEAGKFTSQISKDTTPEDIERLLTTVDGVGQSCLE